MCATTGETLYIAKALFVIASFQTYKYFDIMAIRGIYSLLRTTNMAAKTVGLLKKFINDQTLSTAMGRGGGVPAGGLEAKGGEPPHLDPQGGRDSF